jgi:hypothetical protein
MRASVPCRWAAVSPAASASAVMLEAIAGQHRERFDRDPVFGGGITVGIQAPCGFP